MKVRFIKHDGDSWASISDLIRLLLETKKTKPRVSVDSVVAALLDLTREEE